jgi:hypothetical protein
LMQVTFFQQGTIPCVSKDGRFIMETPYRVCFPFCRQTELDFFKFRWSSANKLVLGHQNFCWNPIFGLLLKAIEPFCCINYGCIEGKLNKKQTTIV